MPTPNEVQWTGLHCRLDMAINHLTAEALSSSEAAWVGLQAE